MSHLLGYARVSTGDQHPDLQVDALTQAGCYRVAERQDPWPGADRPSGGACLQARPLGNTPAVV